MQPVGRSGRPRKPQLFPADIVIKISADIQRRVGRMYDRGRSQKMIGLRIRVIRIEQVIRQIQFDGIPLACGSVYFPFRLHRAVDLINIIGVAAVSARGIVFAHYLVSARIQPDLVRHGKFFGRADTHFYARVVVHVAVGIVRYGGRVYVERKVSALFAEVRSHAKVHPVPLYIARGKFALTAPNRFF